MFFSKVSFKDGDRCQNHHLGGGGGGRNIPGLPGAIPGILIMTLDLPLKQRIEEFESFVSSST
jgi:hypothetical protein